VSTVLVTGADGFVGRWVLRAALGAGWEVLGAVQPGPPRHDGLTDAERAAVRWLPLELCDPASVRAVAARRCDAVVHLAAVASGSDALQDPGLAWAVNAAGTARLLGEFGRRCAAGECDPTVLCCSTAEVYGRGATRPLVETDPAAPCSPYAASKLGAELAARETQARTGLRVVLSRAFPHTGPGQDERFVVPAFARRLRGARRAGAKVVKVGNLAPVRDLLDVRDVAAAYVALLERGAPGEAYNVCSGQGHSLEALFHQLSVILGVDAIHEADPALVRPADILYLVGDAAKLRRSTGWVPSIPLDQTLRDVIDAQAD
jgi:GDP-4-dehydro-6-deoxy-D-mannose reductase